MVNSISSVLSFIKETNIYCSVYSEHKATVRRFWNIFSRITPDCMNVIRHVPFLIKFMSDKLTQSERDNGQENEMGIHLFCPYVSQAC